MVIILVIIGGYFINGYYISDYFINDYWWIFYC
jgi:hypothetical protein